MNKFLNTAVPSMHIEADLDEIYGERLADLQLRLQKPLSEGVRLKVMHTNSAMLQITPGVQGLPCLLTPNARQALHSSITFNRTLSEVLATVIDWAWTQTPQAPDALPEPLSVGQWQTLDLSRDSLYNDDGR